LAAWINRRRQDFAASEPFRGNLWGRAQSLAARYPLWSTGLAGGLVASSWYALNLVRVFTFAWNNAFGTIGDDYKAPGFGLWLLALPREGVSYYYALALLALVPAGCAILWRRRGMHWETRHTLMLAWFVPAAVALLIARSDSVRFAMPILPVAAIALARAMDVVSGALSRQAWVRAMLVTALLVLPLLGFTRTTFGGPSFANSLYPESYWFRPPDQQGQWNQLRIFEALHRLAPDPHRDYYVVVGVEHVYLNANLLNYYRVREGGPFAFMTFGYAQTSAEQAVNLINERQARFIVMAEGFQDGELPAFLNAVNGEIRDLLDQNKLPFRYRETVRLTDRLAVRFYERVEGSRAPGGGD
jgi:hypothetical protein